MTDITREEVEAELTRRFKEGGLEKSATMQDANKLACKIATDMACEEKYAPFFKHLYQPSNYSVGCSIENNSLTDIEKGRLNVDITLSGPMAEQYRRIADANDAAYRNKSEGMKDYD